jgi:predicted dehydrogenase
MNVLLIGFGYWGRNIARVINANTSVKLYGIADLNSEYESYIKDIYPNTILSTSYKDFITDPKVEAVIIATPAYSHLKLVYEFVDVGKHVLCEKPLGFCRNEFQQLRQKAEQERVILMVGYTFLYNSIVKFIKKRIEGKSCGKFLYATFKRTGLGPIRTDTNVIADLAVHDFSMCIYWFGIPIWVKNSSDKKNPEVAFIQLGYPNDFIINIHVSWLSPMKQRVVEIVTDKEMIVFDDVSTSEKLKIISTGTSYLDKGGDYARFQRSVKDGDILIPNIDCPEPLSEEFSSFIKMIEVLGGNEENLAISEEVSSVLEALDL